MGKVKLLLDVIGDLRSLADSLQAVADAGHLGLPIPEKLKDILAQLHDRAESGKGDE